MKVLITGAGGQLGREWHQALKESGTDLAAFTSSELDITLRNNVQTVLASEQPDVVINCAAYTAVDRAETDSEKAFRVNMDGVRYLADACAETGAILVHFSTDYVFPGKSADRIIYPKGYPEDAARKPVNIYGESKLAGELELEKSDAEWLLIRVSWLCSPFGKNFVNTMIRLGSVKNKLSVVEDQIGSPTYTFDVVAKTRKLLEMGKRGTFHVSSEGAISWADFAEEIFHITEMNVEVERVPSSEYPTDAERPAFSLLSTEKIRTVGLSPREWKEGLKQLIELRGQ